MTTIETALFRAIADFSSLDRASRRTAGELGKVDASAEETFGRRFAQRIQQRSTDLRRFGGSMSRDVSLPIAALGGVAVHTFADFEKSLEQARLKAGATTEELDLMRKAALKTGKSSTFSARETAEAMDELAALGFNARDAIAALPGVVSAAQASQSGLALTSKIVGQSLKTFNMEASKAGYVADVLANASNVSAIDMQGLGDALAHAGQLGISANQSFEDVVSSISRLVDMGVPAASAGVAVRQMFDSLKSGSQRANASLRGLGIEVRDANGEMLPMVEVMKNVKAGLDDANPVFRDLTRYSDLSADAQARLRQQFNMGDRQFANFVGRMEESDAAARDFILSQALGTEGMKAFNLLAGDSKPLLIDLNKEREKATQLSTGLAKTMGKDEAQAWIAARTEGGKFKATAEDIITAQSAMARGSDGLSERIGQAFSETTSAKIEQVGGGLETLVITLITKAQPAINDTADFLIRLIDAVDKFANEHPQAVTAILAIVAALAAIGPVSWVLGVLLSPVAKIVRGFSLAGKGLVRFGKYAKATSQGTTRLGRVIDGVRLRAGYMKDAMIAAGKNGARRLAWWWGSLQAKAAALGRATLQAMKALGRWVKQAIIATAQAAKQAALWTIARARMIAHTVATWAMIAATKAWAAAQWLANKALAMNPIVKVVLLLFALAAAVVWAYKNVGWFRKGVNLMWAAVKVAFAAIGKAATWLWKNVFVPAFRGLGKVMSLWWNYYAKPIFSAFKKTFRGLVSFVGTIVERIGTAWSKIKDVLADPIQWIIDNVVNRLIDALNWVLDKLGMKPLPKFGGGGGGSDNKPKKEGPRGGGKQVKDFRAGGRTPHGGAWQPVGVVHGDEFVTKAESRRRFERRHPGMLDYINDHGRLPGYRGGGTVKPAEGTMNRHSGYANPAWDINVPGGGDLGNPVRAYKAGKVAFVGFVTRPDGSPSYGNTVRINHDDGSQTLYAHLSKFQTAVGRVVEAGDLIGNVGSTGNSSGPHLHFEIRGGTYQGPGGDGGGGLLDLVGGVKGKIEAVANRVKSFAQQAGPVAGSFAKGTASLLGGAISKYAGSKAGGAALGLTPLGMGTKVVQSLFDNGGYLQPGTTLVHNETRRPEPVFTAPQWDTLLGNLSGPAISATGALNPARPAAGDFVKQKGDVTQSFTWHVHNPVREKTSASTLKTLTKQARRGLFDPND